MFTLRGRLACGLTAFALAAALLAVGEPLGWLLLASPPLLAWGFVRYGPMVLAFRAYQARDWPRLERLLAEVRRPAWLRAQDQAYFAFLSGVLAQVRGDAPTARARLAAVDPARLRTDHMRCVLACHRVEAALAAGDRAEARAHLAAARSLPHRAEADAAIAKLAARVAAA